MADTQQPITEERYLDALSELYNLCLGIDERLARAEETLQRIEDLTADPVDPYVRLDERLTQTERALQSLQAAVPEIDKTVHALGANIGKRFDRTEEALRRTESLGVDRTLRQLAASMDTRLAETTETISRIERLVGGVSFREFSAVISARLLQTEEALRQIERVLYARRSNRVDESHLQPSPDVRAVRSEFTRAMAVSRTLRTAQHRAAHLWAMVRAVRRSAHDGAAPAWIAAVPGVNASRLARQCAAVLVLAGVLAVVTVRFDDPRLGFRNSGGDGPRQAINSGKPTSGTAPAVVVPTRQSVAVLASTMQTTESGSQAVVVTPLSRQAVIPDPPEQTAPDDVDQIQDATRTQFVGTLEVTSNPAGASVFGNGRLLGVTPLRVSKQRAGSLALQITREGYQRWSTSIQVRADQLTRVVATLRPADF